jgi:prevent-host-death family protein
MKTWAVHDAKARFSELLNAAQTEGPQMVLRRGEETAVVVSKEEWQRLKARKPVTLKEWLMSDKARGDLVLPDRKTYRRRPPSTFE